MLHASEWFHQPSHRLPLLGASLSELSKRSKSSYAVRMNWLRTQLRSLWVRINKLEALPDDHKHPSHGDYT
jgi:hypothetical protein